MKPDQYNIDEIRKAVNNHVYDASVKWDKPEFTILNVAPDEHNDVSQYFKHATVKTLDIKAGCDYQGDLCDIYLTHQIQEKFNCIICTEVLEHVSNPFYAASNLCKMIQPDGELYITTPFNLRIHNPLPDNWRFTEHGLRELFKGQQIQITQTDTPNRELMPLGYQCIIRNQLFSLES